MRSITRLVTDGERSASARTRRALYAFVVEGLLSVLAGDIQRLGRLTEFFVSANGYSMVSALGV